MTAPARLLALRLQGFKSFAERTVVEFGPGISAVVGPNGSGKSNLADALRWSLGEQGRALRSRKSEDVIFAGSERRSALGMADVTLVLDNGDGLLPVDFSVLELGRRLYRSGENDYLLNKQRIRLRDLVDLLDGAHLADNAFLFIGQGMVDQALALRPEERRPLFEEVAGVRRHERKRRRSEEQLVESDANLARVEDILAELRPQARRLAAQAEQQATRASAGDDLATALLIAAHARWHEAAAIAGSAAARVERERLEADRAMADLGAAEETAAAIAGEMGERAAAERDREAAAEAARTAVTDLRLREARLAGDLDAIERDRVRLIGERDAALASLSTQRRSLAAPVPPRDVDLEAEVADAERLLAEATAELAALRAAGRARGEEAAALRRAEAAREAEAETARRRLAEASRRLETERSAMDTANAARIELDAAHAAARDAATAASAALERAAAERQTERSALDEVAALRRSAEEREAAATASLAAASARLASLEARLEEDEARGIARAARRHGGRRVDEDLQVDPASRAAVEAILDELARAYVVDSGAATGLAGERGHLVVRERATAVPASEAAATRRFLDRLADAGGSTLADAVRRDATGSVGSLLARAAVVPDLTTAMDLQPVLPAGWSIATRDGSAVVTELTVRLGRGDAPLERRTEAERLRAEVSRLTVEAERAGEAVRRAVTADESARERMVAADATEARLGADRRRAEDAERSAARALEAAARESAWHAAQVERLRAEVDRVRQELDGIRPTVTGGPAEATGTSNPVEARASLEWEARVVDQRTRRDRLQADLAVVDAARRDAETRRARAEATVAMEEERIVRCEADLAALAERAQRLVEDRSAVSRDLALATESDERAAAALAEVRAADSADRERLTAAERAASTARDRLRSADERLRAADRADLEARLGRDALREQLLVELAGLGELGRRHLEDAAGVRPVAVGPGPVAPAISPKDDDEIAPDGDDAEALESALDAAAARWATEPPAGEPPTPARLASLRRRYHELGAANPFAVGEYDEVRRRLETLEAQREDLRAAIDKTRRLIAELNDMIATQFRATFAALETAFDRRFQQLFGGGFARLSLTDPEDLSATGVEIVARPPGKKAQALAMLSGGERALTAVALLFAMLEIRPVPFCVLDEVDAALDEANVGRFSEALRGLAERTQFIVITHNRGTIEAADALYGVTVGDDSVSRVISLRLDEARAIADRQRGERVAAADRNGAEAEPAIDELAEVG